MSRTSKSAKPLQREPQRSKSSKVPVKSAVVRSEITTRAYNARRFPTLRTALWLYFAVLIGTTAILLSLPNNIDPFFLRLMVALFVTGGFTAVALYLTKQNYLDVLGGPITPLNLVTSFFMGLATFVLAEWLSFNLGFKLLDLRIGTLPPTLPSQISVGGAIFEFVIVIPFCQGLLMWGFVQGAAGRVNRVWGATLAGILYAFYGLFSNDVGTMGIGVIPGRLVVGLFAAFTVAFAGSAWYGILVCAGASVGFRLLEPYLYGFVGTDSNGLTVADTFSVRWLLIVAVTAFVAFILFQVMRLRAAPTFQAGDDQRVVGHTAPRKPGRLWWIPLLLSCAVFVLVISSELSLRLTFNPVNPRVPTPSPTSATGETAPPVPAR